MGARFWQLLDATAHALHLPWHGWICDRFDLSLGITRDELNRTAPAWCPHIWPYSGTSGLACGCGLPIVRIETSAAAAAWPA